MKAILYIFLLLAALAIGYFYLNPNDFYAVLYGAQEVVEAVAGVYLKK